MIDPIDGQAALDAMDAMDTWNKYGDENDVPYVRYNDMVHVIKTLPSAQLEVTEEAVKEYCRKRCLCVVDSALLKKYASAQPHTEADIQKMQDLEQAELEKAFELGREDALSEIVRCNDCKHSEHWYRDKRRCFLWAEDGIDVFEDGFCNYAERRNL